MEMHYGRIFLNTSTIGIQKIEQKFCYCHCSLNLRACFLPIHNSFGYKQDKNTGGGGNKVNKT
jgi:hypothetical protein